MTEGEEGKKRNFLDYTTGDMEKTLNKKIAIIIAADHDYIVFLDDENVIQWSHIKEMEKEQEALFYEINTEIAYWEEMVGRVFLASENILSYKRLLAETYVMVLCAAKEESAKQYLKKITAMVTAHGHELMRKDCVLGSLGSATIFSIVLLFLVCTQKWLPCCSGMGVSQVLMAALFGGVGAFILTMTSISSYTPELTFNKVVILDYTSPQVDGILRVIYGIVAGTVVAVGMKSNLLFGAFNGPGVSYYTYMFLGFSAGASTKMLSGIISQVENNSTLGKSE